MKGKSQNNTEIFFNKLHSKKKTQILETLRFLENSGILHCILCKTHSALFDKIKSQNKDRKKNKYYCVI